MDFIKIALDAMGGDHAPKIVVEGASLALAQQPDLFLTLFGDRDKLDPWIKEYSLPLGRFDIVHTSAYITSDLKPSIALRQSKGSSMRLAIEHVVKGGSHGVVSAGNTGAYMAIAKLVFRTIPGIERPAIASMIPNKKGASVVLDLGANIQCDMQNLIQFAIMGRVYAQGALGRKNPKVGLLNVGSEDLKGHAYIQEAAQMLRALDSFIDFHGFIEGNDIGLGTVDVVVADGFSGNIALKSIEGLAQMLSYHLKQELSRGIFNKLGALLSFRAFNRFRQKFDPRKYNGAIFIGLNGVAVKSHGGADGVAFAHAIKEARTMVSHHFNDKIRQDLEHAENILGSLEILPS